MGFDVGNTVGNGINSWAAPFVTDAVKWTGRLVWRLVSAYPQRALLLLTVVPGFGCSVVAVEPAAPVPASHYALPFAPELPFMQRAAGPPPKQVPAILAPGRLPSGS